MVKFIRHLDFKDVVVGLSHDMTKQERENVNSWWPKLKTRKQMMTRGIHLPDQGSPREMRIQKFKKEFNRYRPIYCTVGVNK